MEDSKIIELFFARSEQAISELASKYGKLCLKIAKNILSNTSDAEECVNDTYLGAWNSIPPAKPDPLQAYICRIVRNISIMKYHSNTAAKRNSFYSSALDELEFARMQGRAYHVSDELLGELKKASHRKYTTGFMFDDGEDRQNYLSSSQTQESTFRAIVLKADGNRVFIEQRNKFKVGDSLEILSPNSDFNKKAKVIKIEDEKGQCLDEAKLVQQRIWLTLDGVYELTQGDILRS